MNLQPTRSILHLDLDSFYVSVERLRDSRLNDKPVLVGGVGERSVVAACSYEARRYGVRSAMPMRQARQLCPEAVVVKGDWEAYSQHSQMVTELIREQAPVVEKASIDEFYLDLTGMDRYVGCYRWSGELRQRIVRQTGLSVSLGLSSNKTVAKVATGEAKPAGERYVRLGEEQAFLSPLPISRLPMIGPVTAQTLRGLGITRLGTLGQMPLRILEKAFGSTGRLLWDRANGRDETPVVPYHEPKSVSKETTLDEDTADRNYLRAVLIRLTEEAAWELRRGGHSTGQVTIKIRYANFDTHTQQRRLSLTTADHILIPQALDLLDKLWQRRLRIRLVGVRLGQLARGTEQLGLFDQSSRLSPLYGAMDRLRNKYGRYSINWASGWQA
ncbi:DNA polymerase IV [Nibrella saemangeumensis]|uniref:DNA polymerase IV n=1 Tax=Nibrella saemangeumensis TaxID=1084526 RepID=A0ABP8N4M8_9BACT